MIKISVIVPTYTPTAYIYECVNSLYTQSFPLDDFELIVILNGELDGYRNLLEEIYRKKPDKFQMSIFETEKAGVSGARNIGIENAIGEYLFFLDDDDVLSSNYLADMYNLASNDCIVASNVYSFCDVINEKNYDYLTYTKLGKELFYNRKYLSNSCCKLISRKIIGDRRFDVSFSNGEDALFMFSISDKIKNIKVAKESIYYRRIRKGSASRKKVSTMLKLRRIGRQQLAYIKIYFSKPFKYSFLLLLSRLVAVYKQ